MEFLCEKITATAGRICVPDQMWCYGDSTVVRVGDSLFATHTRVLPERPGLPCTVMELFAKRGEGAWHREFSDEGRYQREPCPILSLGNGLIGVTVNPCDETEPEDPWAGGSIASTPQLYVFDVSGPARLVRRVTLRWDDPAYRFAEHSYRSSAVDAESGVMLFTNGHYPPGSEGEHCYTLMDKAFSTLRSGALRFALRSCYHNICMRAGETYLFAVRDVIETQPEWKAYKQAVTGNIYDYAIRAVTMLYTPDIRKQEFGAEKVVLHRDDTCGRVCNLDCARDADGDVVLVCAVTNIQMDFMRDVFFPGEKLEKSLEVLRLRAGAVIGRRVIDVSGECGGKNPATEYGAALHTMPDGSLRLLWSKRFAPAQDAVPDGLYLCNVQGTERTRISERPIGAFFISRCRLGAAPSDTVDLVWVEADRDPRELHDAYMHGRSVEDLEFVYMHGQLKL